VDAVLICGMFNVVGTRPMVSVTLCKEYLKVATLKNTQNEMDILIYGWNAVLRHHIL